MEAGAGRFEITSLMAARSEKKAGGNEASCKLSKLAPTVFQQAASLHNLPEQFYKLRASVQYTSPRGTPQWSYECIHLS